jgi:ABC-type nitrate/sulfonate/bicarbonate transport system substrate-binding protein
MSDASDAAMQDWEHLNALYQERDDLLERNAELVAELNDAHNKAWKYLQECGAQARRNAVLVAALESADIFITNNWFTGENPVEIVKKIREAIQQSTEKP